MFCTECGTKCSCLNAGISFSEYECENPKCKARFEYDGDDATYQLKGPGEPFSSEGDR